MGFDADGVRFLVFAESLGVNFSTIATIGKQQLNLTSGSFRSALARRRRPAADMPLVVSWGEFADSFLRSLGAVSVTSFDVSPYEGAEVLHDFNLPIASQHHAAYSVVIDGGSLEHVFNYPVALGNCMRMVAPGGHLLTLNPANNYMGHGFYQIGPDVPFNMFVPQNGFELVKVITWDEGAEGRWYEVTDPSLTGGRIEFANGRPVTIAAIAKRTKIVDSFAPQQQSYYEEIWSAPAKKALTVDRFKTPLVKRLYRKLPVRFRKIRLHDRRYFRPLDFR